MTFPTKPIKWISASFQATLFVMGTAGPIVQEAVRVYACMHEHESDVDDSSEEEEHEEDEVDVMERPVKKRKGSPGQSARRVCREEGCDKWARASGLCVAHGGVGRTKPCSVEGCGTLAASKGLCGEALRSHAVWRAAAR